MSQNAKGMLMASFVADSLALGVHWVYNTNVIVKKYGRVTDLTTLPDLYVRVKNVIDDPNASHKDLADVLSIDPVISARLLRVANSAFYGLPSQIATISRAVNLLGTQQVHDLVLATAVIQTLEDSFPPALRPSVFWRESLLAAAGLFSRGDSPPVNDLTTLLETDFEERAQFDAVFGFAEEFADSVPLIEHVQGEGTLTQPPNPDRLVPFEASKP